MTERDLWRAYLAAAERYDSAPTPKNFIARFEAWLAWESVFVREAA